MKIIKLALALSTVIVFSGCAAPKLPLSADEMRQNILAGNMAPTESYEVKQDFNKLSKLVKNKATECLAKRITVTKREMTSYGNFESSLTHEYIPTVIIGKQTTELHLQLLPDPRKLKMGYPELHKNGMYTLVADLHKQGEGTVIDLYYGKHRLNPYNYIIDSVKGWIDGTSTECVELN